MSSEETAAKDALALADVLPRTVRVARVSARVGVVALLDTTVVRAHAEQRDRHVDVLLACLSLRRRLLVGLVAVASRLRHAVVVVAVTLVRAVALVVVASARRRVRALHGLALADVLRGPVLVFGLRRGVRLV